MTEIDTFEPVPKDATRDGSRDDAKKPTEVETVETGEPQVAMPVELKAAEPVALKAAAPVSEPAAGWQVVSVKARVDSFNQSELIDRLKELRRHGHDKIALDLRGNRFLNFPTIRHCVDAARELAGIKGSFAVIGCTEKTKRHFEIYGSLDHIQVVRTERELGE